MKKLTAQPHHSIDEIKKKITSIKGYNDVIDYKIIQCIKSVPNISAEEIAKVQCISVNKVYSVIQNYNNQGTNYKKDAHWGGRRRQTSHLSLEEEKQILDQLRERAVNGYILTAKDVKAEFEKRIHKKVSDDYIWDVFKRHNWSKKTPRPEHPKTDYSKQEEFKKNSQKTWQPVN